MSWIGVGSEKNRWFQLDISISFDQYQWLYKHKCPFDIKYFLFDCLSWINVDKTSKERVEEKKVSLQKV